MNPRRCWRRCNQREEAGEGLSFYILRGKDYGTGAARRAPPQGHTTTPTRSAHAQIEDLQE
jgi:hypothetical protein